jgi:hypothetical protein
MMTSEQRLAYQQQWEAELVKQVPHPVYLPVRVRWDLGWDEVGCVVETGQRVAVDESALEMTTEAARRDPWADESFVIDRRFVEWPDCSRTAEGFPLLPWSALGADGSKITPLRLFVLARRKLCEGTDSDPFSAGWLSEGYRAIFIEMCKLRLARPGEVLEMLLLGGNRAGKTFSMLLAAVANWRSSPRPAGVDFGQQWKGMQLIMHSGETISGSEHQVPYYYFMPKSVRNQARGNTGNTRMSKTEDTVFNFSGSGFTNGSFNLPIEVKDADGGTRRTGGEVRFRSYNGSPNTYEGPEYNLILMDEEVSVTVYENMKRGLASRAVVTNEQWFLDEIKALLTLLESQAPMTQMPRELLGLLMQSWEVAMFTPVSGFTQLVRVKLQGITAADMWGWYDSPILAAMPGVPTDASKPGGDKRKVPQFAKDPSNPNQLIAWFHTRWNCVKPAVRTMLNNYKASGWKEVRKRLYGYVESDTASAFGTVYDEEKHLCDWAEVPEDGTFYEVIDPASAKPWAISWNLVDIMERHYLVQEWPCEHIPVNGELPGPWAVPSMKKERFNGEEGPAWSLPQRSISQWVLQVWEGRRRVLEKYRELGKTYRGPTERRKLVLEWCPDGAGGIKILKEDEEREYIVPEMTIMDGRFAAAHTDSVRGSEDVTIAERVFEDPNSILIEPADGVRLAEGDALIVDRLTTQVMGLPAVRINTECTNTRFMFRHYTRPAFRENTAAKDEVCKEWRDLMAYFYLKGPCFVRRYPENEDSLGGGY